jgi:Fe-S cluster assembly protein SufD
MSSIEYIKEKFDQLQLVDRLSNLRPIRQQGFSAFNRLGIPALKHEEWKYTRISSRFRRDYQIDLDPAAHHLSAQALRAAQLPGHDQASTIVFVNGLYAPALSTVRSAQLIVLPLEQAAASDSEYSQLVANHLGHSGRYATDGINALSTAFLHGAVFVLAKRGQAEDQPLYFYHVTEARQSPLLCQPRSLVYLQEHARLSLVENFVTLGQLENFSNHVTEIVVEKDAVLDYYKIQQDRSQTTQVSTTHIHQIGRSQTQSLTVSLDGGLIRNNLHVVLDSSHSESHIYGLYCLQGKSHVDNHTLVDHAVPNCMSNELYKGIVDEQAVAVFNGKIWVRKDAQKTNAYQSNKNMLLSDDATVNSKPQLEIFADDVKCSHGCTVGSLDEEAQFYLRSRGLSQGQARAFLLRAFALDILEPIRLAVLRTYIDQLISNRLQIEAS